MINNRIFQIKTIMLSLIFCFLSLSFFVSHAYCSEDNPYCTDDQGRIQELTDEFIQKYGDEVKIRYNDTTGIPRRVYNIYPNPSEVDIENPKQTAISFLSENSLFLGIDNINDLKFKEVDDLSTLVGYKVDYEIFYKGVPLFGSGNKVRVNITEMSDGRIRLTVLSDYIPCIDLDVDPTITSAEAANIVKKDLGVSRLVFAKRTYGYSQSGTGGSPYGIYANIFNNYPSPYPYIYSSPSIPSPYSYSSRFVEESVEPELIIYDKDGEVYLAWKFLCSKEPYESGVGYYYYIDAHTGNIVDNYEVHPFSSSGEIDNSSSNNVTSNPYNPYNPINSPYNTPYNTPYSPYNPINNPYIFTPYSTPYNPYSFPTSGNLFPGNLFNLMPNYNYGWNQPFYGSGMTYSPQDIAIMAAGGNPPWFEIPDWEERLPYLYGLNNPYGSPPPPLEPNYPIFQVLTSQF